MFITGFHNKPHCCGASVASAAGAFITKKIDRVSETPELEEDHRPEICALLGYFFLRFLTLEDGTDRLPRNVDTELPLDAA